MIGGDPVEVAYQTAIGKKRTENQDYVSVFRNQADQQLIVLMVLVEIVVGMCFCYGCLTLAFFSKRLSS